MAGPFEVNGNGWGKLIATIGLPSVLALLFAGFLMYNITAAHTAMAQQLTRVEAMVHDNGKKMDSLETLIKISRQTCLNTAPDAGARRACLE